MSSNKKLKLLRTIFRSNAGCGCGRPKASDIHEPTQKPKTTISPAENPKPCISSSSSCDRNGGLSMDEEDFTSTSISEAETDLIRSSKNPKPCQKIINSIAVEKDSSDPYQDFRHSMLQMILQKEIYSKEDLQELLNWFLKLNSPCHHDVIFKAFKEIWDDVVSDRLILLKPACVEEKSCES
ncbi:transcription repressor OFP6-like [Juglans microcarpa x Juglans regia]|uniref:transcription repressor OFP6-like n=1 Tax=Juglans microcarpa x Juglans regia TaxID=2249226 RepID=UPI001B7DE510|nr:transcription repressor OFP6-like [Juglans microcarpa x Juglans regia]